MKAFVLAAGFGSRLAPITDATPKPLLPVGNTPLIGYSLRLCAHFGIHDVVVNLHHLGKSLKEQIGDGTAFGVNITYSEEEEILGTGGGLKKMHDYLSDDTFVVLNADTVFDVDLQAVIDAHRGRGALATMVLREDAQAEAYGTIEIDDAERIQSVLGNHRPDQDGRPRNLRGLMFTGVHVLEPRFLDYIPPDVRTCVNRYGYVKALANNEPLYGYVADGYWTDAGTPNRYLQSNLDALEQRFRLEHADPLAGFALAPKKEVAEVIRMGADVQLGSDVRLIPPLVLGNDTRVGDRATVGPGCVVGHRAVIGKDAKLSECVLLDGAKTEPGARVHRQIVSRKSTISVDGT